MKQLLAVVKNELIRYFISPLAYVYLVSFLILPTTLDAIRYFFVKKYHIQFKELDFLQ